MKEKKSKPKIQNIPNQFFFLFRFFKVMLFFQLKKQF